VCPADAGLSLRRELGIPEGHRVISLLPGSRQREVRQLMPLLGQVLSRMDADRATAHVLVSCLRPEFRQPIEAALRSCPFPARILDVDARRIIMAGDIVLVASGTASLEVVYFEKPMVVLYRVGAVARFFFQLMSVTPFFTLPNILGGRLFGGRPVVLEKLCKGGEAPEIARAAGELLAPGPAREDAISRLREVKASAFRPGATARAADLLLDFASRIRLEPPGEA
jgi:lipid-A-disaccharide synthase